MLDKKNKLFTDRLGKIRETARTARSRRNPTEELEKHRYGMADSGGKFTGIKQQKLLQFENAPASEGRALSHNIQERTLAPSRGTFKREEVTNLVRRVTREARKQSRREGVEAIKAYGTHSKRVDTYQRTQNARPRNRLRPAGM